jgi:hypothetical protein
MYNYTFFISYSTRFYLRDAMIVTLLFKLRGHRVWFDLEQTPERLVDPFAIAYMLSKAVQQCKHLLFFDLRSWLDDVAARVGGGSDEIANWMASRAPFWQWFERQYGDRIIDIVPKQETIEFGCPQDNRRFRDRPHVIPYTGYIDAVTKIEEELGL